MISIHWFRRDLRLEDNASLFHALKSGNPVLCLFIFDTSILEKLNDKSDARVNFIHSELENLKKELENLGSSLLVKHGEPLEIWKELITDFKIDNVFANHDYEPLAINRDKKVKDFLISKNIPFLTFKDQVIFEKDEIVKDDGTPYTVFTPYSKKWKAKLNDFYLNPYPTEKYVSNFYKTDVLSGISLGQLGFTESETQFPPKQTSQNLIKNYEQNRDIPSIEGTSRLSMHFRFGTISIRQKVAKALAVSEKWLNELIWREFYMSILFHFPQVVTTAFKPNYDRIEWINNTEHYEKWCCGKTGYPIVDAGMRELNATGFMHNRVRMITASFLTKHLLIDWRWGEAYFAEKLLDYELASNNGGWQWAAGSGVDAAPYFRIFNPSIQTQKFDSNHIYIKKWVPEFNTLHYVPPIIDHDFARKRCLETYKAALNP
ncbi:MAG: cryptochrome/photolyase family protein [Bacteroidia bacterium]